MAVNLTNADKALKTYYLDAVSEQLNKNANPLLARIKQTTNDVWGKEVRKLVTYGINGGIGAGTEDGLLPTSQANNYEQLVVTLKNLYGTIQISDKAIRASENNSGAFVNLLNAEMEGLIQASSYNFGRMLFGDGSGKLANVIACVEGKAHVDNVDFLAEGMCVNIIHPTEGSIQESGVICAIDRENALVTLSGKTLKEGQIELDSLMVIQGSYNKEITGLGKIFDLRSQEIYGLSREEHGWLNPYVKKDAGQITELMIQTALDEIEKRSGSAPNFIVCSMGVRRALQNMFAQNRQYVNTVELEGGFKAMSYNGIPIVADKFCPHGTMYLLNTNDFALHQLCDWEWLADDNGKILTQISGKPVYNATLVKYAELLCSKPCGQGEISGISEVY